MLKLKKMLAVILMASLMLAGCGKVKLSTGLSKNVFARIGGNKIDMSFVYLLLGEQKCLYENTLDNSVWTQRIGNVSMEEYVKNEVSDTVKHIQILKNMADDMDVSISSDEKERIDEAAQAYYKGVTATEDFSVDTVKMYYEDVLLAQKVFYNVTKDVDTEVSEDEARVISVQYIFFSVLQEDENGRTVEISPNEKQKKKVKAAEILEKIRAGEDFSKFAIENSDDKQSSLEFGRGQYSEEFENAAFKLEVGEVSDIVEASNGYYIIKCSNDNVESDYDKRAKEVVLSRRNSLFASYYSEFVADIECEINEKYWSDIRIADIRKGSGRLNEIYQKVVVSTQSY